MNSNSQLSLIVSNPNLQPIAPLSARSSCPPPLIAPNLPFLATMMNSPGLTWTETVEEARHRTVLEILNGTKQARFDEDRLLAAYYMYSQIDPPTSVDHAWKVVASALSAYMPLPVAGHLLEKTPKTCCGSARNFARTRGTPIEVHHLFKSLGISQPIPDVGSGKQIDWAQCEVCGSPEGC